ASVPATAAVWVPFTAAALPISVFEPAAVEVRVPVATPLAFVVPTGCISVFPVVGVAASVTVAPAIGFPFASRAVTVMVDAPLPATIGDGAVTVDWVAATAPAVPIAVSVTGLPLIPAPAAVAARAFDPPVVASVPLP